MKKLLFENPFYIYVSLAVAELVLLAIWHEVRTRRWLVAMAAPVLLAAAVFAISSLVVTDGEQIRKNATQIAMDMEKNEYDKVGEFLSDRFVADVGGMRVNKQEVLELAKTQVQSKAVRSIKLNFIELNVEGDQAAMSVDSVISIEVSGMRGQDKLRWEVKWAKENGMWRIVALSEPTGRSAM